MTNNLKITKNWIALAAAVAGTALLTAPRSKAAVFLDYFEYAVTPTVGTDAANLNGSSFQVGSWSGSVPLPGSTPTAHPGSALAGTGQLVNPQAGSIHIDRPTADAFIRGDFTRPLPLDGTQVNFDMALSRGVPTTHDKDVEIVGLDASANEAFRLQVSGRTTGGAQDVYRLGYYSTGGTVLSWDFPGATDADGDFSGATLGQYTPDFSRISVFLEPSGYAVSFARANQWASTLIPYNEAAGDLVAIEFRFQGSNNDNFNSGFFLDNLYAGARQVPEPSTATLLLIGVMSLRYGRKLLQPKQRLA